jgi:magnesium-transporting ATPase (P-type)
MSWLKMHLNWAMVFGWILAIGAGFVIIFFAGICMGAAAAANLMAYPSQNLMETVGTVTLLIATTLLSIAVSIWACIQKGRSWGWAFLWLVPFGFIVLLVLKNKRLTSGG